MCWSALPGSLDPKNSTVPPGGDVICTFTNVAASVVTNSSLCPFDVDGAVTGQQLRLIYVQEPLNPSTSGLTASNPGKFYYSR